MCVVILARLLVCALGPKAELGAALATTAGPEIKLESEPERVQGECMSDIAFLAASIVFFLVAVLYVHGCQKLTKGGEGHA